MYSSGLENGFSELKDPAAFLHSIKNSKISLEDARHKQEKFSRYLKKIRIWNKSEKQKKTKTFCNFNKIFNGKNDTIKFVDN